MSRAFFTRPEPLCEVSKPSAAAVLAEISQINDYFARRHRADRRWLAIVRAALHRSRTARRHRRSSADPHRRTGTAGRGLDILPRPRRATVVGRHRRCRRPRSAARPCRRSTVVPRNRRPDHVAHRSSRGPARRRLGADAGRRRARRAPDTARRRTAARSRRSCCAATPHPHYSAPRDQYDRHRAADSAGPARRLARSLCNDQRLAGAVTFGDTGYRRSSCCLYYRTPNGGLCGDCVFTHMPGTLGRKDAP